MATVPPNNYIKVLRPAGKYGIRIHRVFTFHDALPMSASDALRAATEIASEAKGHEG